MYRLHRLADHHSLGITKMNAFDFSNLASDTTKAFRLEAFSFTFDFGLNIYFDDMDDLKNIIGDAEIEFWQVEGMQADTYMKVDNFTLFPILGSLICSCVIPAAWQALIAENILSW